MEILPNSYKSNLSAVCPLGNTMILGFSRKLELWDIVASDLISSYKLSSNSTFIRVLCFRDSAFGITSTSLVKICENGNIEIPTPRTITCLYINGDELVTGNIDGLVSIYSIHNLRLIRNINLEIQHDKQSLMKQIGNMIKGLMLVNDTIVSVKRDQINIWDFRGNNQMAPLLSKKLNEHVLYNITSHDNTVYVSSKYNEKTYCWYWESNQKSISRAMSKTIRLSSLNYFDDLLSLMKNEDFIRAVVTQLMESHNPPASKALINIVFSSKDQFTRNFDMIISMLIDNAVKEREASGETSKHYRDKYGVNEEIPGFLFQDHVNSTYRLGNIIQYVSERNLFKIVKPTLLKILGEMKSLEVEPISLDQAYSKLPEIQKQQIDSLVHQNKAKLHDYATEILENLYETRFPKEVNFILYKIKTIFFETDESEDYKKFVVSSALVRLLVIYTIIPMMSDPISHGLVKHHEVGNLSHANERNLILIASVLKNAVSEIQLFSVYNRKIGIFEISRSVRENLRGNFEQFYKSVKPVNVKKSKRGDYANEDLLTLIYYFRRHQDVLSEDLKLKLLEYIDDRDDLETTSESDTYSESEISGSLTEESYEYNSDELFWHQSKHRRIRKGSKLVVHPRDTNSFLDWWRQETKHHLFTVVIHFRGPWCFVCEEYMGIWTKFASRVRKAGGTVIGVSSLKQKECNESCKTWGLNYPIIGDPDNSLATFLGLETVFASEDSPFSFINDTYANDMAQPCVIVTDQDKRVLYSWKSLGSWQNVWGAFGRPSPELVLQQVNDSIKKNIDLDSKFEKEEDMQNYMNQLFSNLLNNPEADHEVYESVRNMEVPKPTMDNETFPYISSMIQNFKQIEFISEIGYGKTTKSFNAKVGEKGRIVAKITKPLTTEIIENYLIENENFEQMSSPYIVGNLGIAISPKKNIVILQKKIKGSTLLKHLADNYMDLTDSKKLTMLKNLANGLKYLHDNNAVHGNITPDNIVISSTGTAQLMDYGCLSLQNSTLCVHKLAWMAPESMRFNKYDKLSDVYSLGLVFLLVLSGGNHQETIDIEQVARNRRLKVNTTTLDKRYKKLVKNMLKTDPLMRHDVNNVVKILNKLA
eukprot:TRINITY_DN3088_c0_g1_i1.p1 TRINITY_DN3088_c0_g1~~TRINITY_DN3088_c0_g1_i1.p1  ORF type:complete len:1257 (+),score=235.57 TRINITY_DN3088_c0_g1_i1:474-3773(+)